LLGVVGMVTAPSATAAGSNSVTITGSEYAYKVSGSPKSGWTQVTFKNVGSEFHMLLAVPLKPGVTLQQVKKAAATKDPQSAIGALSGNGSTAGIPFLAGPQSGSTTISKLDAGRYALICFFSSPDGKPHLAHGMIGLLTVSKSKSSLTPPTNDVVDVTTSDSAIELPNGTLPTSGWAKVSTTVTSDPLDFTIARYASDSVTFDQANTWVDEFISTGKQPAGDVPVTIAGNVGSFTAGPVSYLKLDLEPGRYVAVSDTDSDDNGSKQLHTDFTVSSSQ
jgi:uncharacterized protein (DUF2141 family)